MADLPDYARHWPLTLQFLARLRRAGDRGVGDTLAHHLHILGINALQKLYIDLTGRDCGCDDRQASLNALFPYRDS